MNIDVQRIKPRRETTSVTFRIDDKDSSGIAAEIIVKAQTQASMDATLAAAHRALAAFGVALAKAAEK